MKRYLCLWCVFSVFCFTLPSCGENKPSRSPVIKQQKSTQTDEESKQQKDTQIAQADISTPIRIERIDDANDDPDTSTPYPTKDASGKILVMSDADKELFDEGIDRIKERIDDARDRYIAQARLIFGDFIPNLMTTLLDALLVLSKNVFPPQHPIIKER